MIFNRFAILSILAFSGHATIAQNYNHYFGNIHAHTAYSDGNQDRVKSKVSTPAGAYAFAKKSKHMDYLGISEHNHSQATMKLESYALGVQQGNEANAEDTFVCLYGMEYGVIKNGGHVLIYGLDSLIGWEEGNYDIYSPKFDYGSLWQILAARPQTFATLAHPSEKDYNDLLNKPYNPVADAVLYGVAARTGPAKSKTQDYSDKPSGTFFSYYRRLLSMGYHVGPTIDHDNHNTTYGKNIQTRTVLLARELTRESLIDAYKSMRFYASDDWNCKIDFTINDQPMGSIIEEGENAIICISVNDDDAAEKVKYIKVLFGVPGSKQISKTLKTSLNKKTLEFTHPVPPGKTYYYHLEITQADGNKIWTAPIWITNTSIN